MVLHKNIRMKKIYFSFASLLIAAAMVSCNDSSTTSTTGTDSSNNASSGTATGTDTSGTTGNAGTGANTATPVNTTPLGKEDSMFVMEAAAGGMEEVEMGNLAQQQATNQRVKDFGAMMVRDHSKANDELKSLASSRGITIPATLPAGKQKDLDNMKKMTGKSFDQHYVNMMVEDHQKDVAKFKKQSTSGKDEQLKTWAGQTLPTLQTHLDSIQAIKKSKL
jgi:putative membrane protein